MLTKFAHATMVVSRDNMVEPETALSTTGATEQFRKLVAELKRIAPRSDEFTYFRCVAIHAMESANLDANGNSVHKGHLSENDGTGKCKVCGANLLQDPKTAEFVDGLWCTGSDTNPYLNQNGDAFPERELLNGYKSFIGRGLFVNHASSDAEKIRGIILDAAWIPKHKCVELLVAIDKVAFPELARQVEAGYSNDVSMGTQVQYSRCSKCGNKAITENDYCVHIKGSKGLGGIYEVNNGLNFIEISIVATGADPKAKIRQVLASLNRVLEGRVQNKCGVGDSVCKVREALSFAQEQISNIKTGNTNDDSMDDIKKQLDVLQKNLGQIASIDNPKHDKTEDLINSLASIKNQIKEVEAKIETKQNNTGGFKMTKAELDARQQKRRAYFQGTTEPTTYPVEPNGGPNGAAETQRLAKEKSGETATLKDGAGKELGAEKEKLQRAELDERKQKRHALLNEGYFQGGGGLNEPQTYPVEPNGGPNGKAESDRLSREKSGETETMKDGAGKELSDHTKEKLQRAKLRAKFTTAAEKKDCKWTVYAGDESVITASVADLYGEDIDKPNSDDPSISNWDWVSSKAYGIEVIRACKQQGIQKTAELMGLKKAADASDPAAAAATPVADVDLGIGGKEEKKGEEGIPAALTTIESAVAEIRALSEGEAGEEGDLEGLELEEGLGEAGAELKGLESTKPASASSDKYREVVSEAIADANIIIQKAQLYVEAAKTKLQRELSKLEKDCEGYQEKCRELKSKSKDLDSKEDKEKIARIEKQIENCEKRMEKCKNKIKDVKKKIKVDEKEKAKKMEKKGEAEVVAPEVKKEETPAAAPAATPTVVAPVVATAAAEMCPECKKEKDKCTCEKKEASLEDRALARRITAGLATEAELEVEAKKKKEKKEKEEKEKKEKKEEKEEKKEKKAEDTTEVKTAQAAAPATDADIKKQEELNKKMGEGVEKKKELEAALQARSTARWAAANSLYGVTPPYDAIKDAHPKGGMTTEDGTGKAIKGQEDGGKVETQTEQQKVDLEVANKTPRGELTARMEKRRQIVASLETNAAADPAAKAYWKAFWGQASDPAGKAYGKEMSEDTKSPIAASDNTKTTTAVNDTKLKMKRAYQVALKQQELGQVKPGKDALEVQVDALMDMDNQGFASFARAVDNTYPVKKAEVEEKKLVRTAGAVQVGAGDSQEDDLVTQLTGLPWRR